MQRRMHAEHPLCAAAADAADAGSRGPGTDATYDTYVKTLQEDRSARAVRPFFACEEHDHQATHMYVLRSRYLHVDL